MGKIPWAGWGTLVWWRVKQHCKLGWLPSLHGRTDTPQERATVRKGMYHDKCRIQISGFGEDTAGEWKRVLARGLLWMAIAWSARSFDTLIKLVKCRVMRDWSLPKQGA